MVTDLYQWVHLFLRWFHVVAGILWLGQTAFFAWLDTRMRIEVDDEGKERVWMVHSGGFYLVEKQVRPELVPKTLHWFRWEAASSWLSGIALLVQIYYMGGLLVGADSPLERSTVLWIGIGVLVVGWVVYDGLWIAVFERHERLGNVVSVLLLVGVAFGLSQVMSGRAAYMHVGALMGTVMAANVWMRILPAQKLTVGALEADEEPDPEPAVRAKMRSGHNTFLALPLIFIMVSSHFPTLSYGRRSNWLMLALFMALGFAARWFMNRWNRRS